MVALYHAVFVFEYGTVYYFILFVRHSSSSYPPRLLVIRLVKSEPLAQHSAWFRHWALSS